MTTKGNLGVHRKKGACDATCTTGAKRRTLHGVYNNIKRLHATRLPCTNTKQSKKETLMITISKLFK